MQGYLRPRPLCNDLIDFISMCVMLSMLVSYILSVFFLCVSVLVEEVLVCADRSQSSILQGFYRWRGNSQYYLCLKKFGVQTLVVYPWFIFFILLFFFLWTISLIAVINNLSLTESLFFLFLIVNRRLILTERLTSVHAIMSQSIRLNATMASRFM